MKELANIQAEGKTPTIQPAVTGDDAYEENDYINAGYGGLFAKTWLSSIAGQGIASDWDVYTVNADPGATNLVIDLRYTYANGDMYMQLYNSNFQKVAQSAQFKDNEYINYALPSSGTYYVAINP